MRMRENLIKLLGDDVCKHDSCDNCEYKESRDACIAFLKERMADYLIANDVVQADELQKMPAADVGPVVHGKWLEWYPGDCALIMTGEEMLYQCSNCGAKYPDVEGYRFCPNCGKIMDGGERDA